MRVEVRVEADEHEWTVAVETDQSVTKAMAIHVATTAMHDLITRGVQ